MNEVNYDYLKEQLRNTGFGDTLNSELADKIKTEAPEFQLTLNKTFGKDTVIANLDFKKGNDSDMYFFNRYQLSVINDKQDIQAKQTFYINKGSSITLKEGYNLLAGRAVHKTLTSKENEKYGAWVQLDFKNTTQNGNFEMKQFHQNYGYDLEKALAKYPIKELADEQSKKQLLSSLERGNLQSTTFQIAGKEEKLFITTNPEYKTLTAYNTAGQKVSLRDLFQKEEQTTKQEQTPSQHVSLYLGRSASSMYKLTSGRLVPYYVPSGKLIYFRRVELDKWVLQNKRSTTQEIEQESQDFLVQSHLKRNK